MSIRAQRLANPPDTFRLKQIRRGVYVVLGAYRDTSDYFSISPLFPEIAAVAGPTGRDAKEGRGEP